MAWWIWVLLGFVLLGLEAMTTSLHIGFFGGAAIVVGMLVGAGFLEPAWSQWLALTVISIVSLAFLRRPMLKRFKLDTPSEPMDTMVGDTAVSLDEIVPGGIGKAEMRGSTWTARNVGATSVSRGDRCVVEKVEGLMIFVRSSQSRS